MQELQELRRTVPGFAADEYTHYFKTGKGAASFTVPREGAFFNPIGLSVAVGRTILGPFVAKDGVSYGQRKGDGQEWVSIRLIVFHPEDTI